MFLMAYSYGWSGQQLRWEMKTYMLCGQVSGVVFTHVGRHQVIWCKGFVGCVVLTCTT